MRPSRAAPHATLASRSACGRREPLRMRPSRAAPHAALASRSACGPREPLRMRPSRAAPRPSRAAPHAATQPSRAAPRGRREPLRTRPSRAALRTRPLRAAPRPSREPLRARSHIFCPPRWPTRTHTFRFNFSDAWRLARPSPTPCCVYSEFSHFTPFSSTTHEAKNSSLTLHFRQNSRHSRDSGTAALAAPAARTALRPLLSRQSSVSRQSSSPRRALSVSRQRG